VKIERRLLPGVMGKIKKNLIDILIISFCALLPVIIAHITEEKPQRRYIHVENFRYGKDPSVIRCSVGDTLYVTFSSRDTGHSFFLEEFDMDVKVSPGFDKVLNFSVADPQRAPIITDTVVFVAEHPGWKKYFVSKSNYRCHVWCGPMHAFESGNLIISPNTLYNFGLGLLAGLFLVGLKRVKSSIGSGESPFSFREDDRGIDILKKAPFLKKIIRKSWFQPALMLFGGFFLYVVLLTTIFGTQMSGRNLGVMLIWSVWLFILVTILTPIGGRIWCLMCPLPTAGEFLQRRSIAQVSFEKNGHYRNKYFGLQLTWPKWMNNGWPRLVAFLIAGTLSTTFVAQPRATGIAILAFVILSTILALIYKLRAFCMFICPINTFIGTYAQAGKLALRKADADVCNNCKGDFCEKGSHLGWACPYDLNVRNIDTNLDCGMCTECIRSCVHDNVTFKWRKFGSEAVIKDISLAWTVMAMFVLGTAYTIVYLGHWPVVRDYVNILDKGNWDLFGIYALLLWGSALVVFPGIMYLVTAVAKKVSGAAHKTLVLMTASTGALIPLGLFIWIAFVTQMLFVNVSFIGQSLSDPFGWGWNLLGLASTPWIQFMPRLIPWLQVVFVIIGFAYSFRNLWRIWINKTADAKKAFKGMLPAAFFLLTVTAALIDFYAN